MHRFFESLAYSQAAKIKEIWIMSGRAVSHYLIKVLLVLLVFFGGFSLAHAQCTKSAVTKAPTIVYDRAPVFSSGSGWQMGNEITKLPANTRIKVCEEVTVGLFINKKKWFRIEFDNGRSGWVFSGQLNTSAAPVSNSGYFGAIFISAAHADPVAENDSATGIPGFNNWLLLGVAFFFVITGMVGKVVFDELDSGKSPSFRSTVNIKKCLKALIVAPIVFVTFLNVGDFSFQTEMAVIIFLCLAFQNGFFWQTVLPTRKVAPGTT
jgi:hypothetical protein